MGTRAESISPDISGLGRNGSNRLPPGRRPKVGRGTHCRMNHKLPMPIWSRAKSQGDVHHWSTILATRLYQMLKMYQAPNSDPSLSKRRTWAVSRRDPPLARTTTCFRSSFRDDAGIDRRDGLSEREETSRLPESPVPLSSSEETCSTKHVAITTSGRIRADIARRKLHVWIV